MPSHFVPCCRDHITKNLAGGYFEKKGPPPSYKGLNHIAYNLWNDFQYKNVKSYSYHKIHSAFTYLLGQYQSVDQSSVNAIILLSDMILL